MACDREIATYHLPQYDAVELLAFPEVGLHRLGLCPLPHTLRPYGFLPRVVESFFAAVVA